eukprot:979410-Pyramimonas_sp.AAC.1
MQKPWVTEPCECDADVIRARAELACAAGAQDAPHAAQEGAESEGPKRAIHRATLSNPTRCREHLGV